MLETEKGRLESEKLQWTQASRHRFVDVRFREVLTLGQVLPSDLFGGFKWPFQGLCDLQLGDQKVTWKKLGDISETENGNEI